MRNLRRLLVGDRTFYRSVLAIVLPVIVQNSISGFVSLLDNIMVGQVGTVEMSGVAIANQLMFVFNICVFGGVSGAGIFGAQFAGARDDEGMRSTFRFKIWTCALLVAIALTVFGGWDRQLVKLYLSDGSDPVAAAETLRHGLAYLHVMLWGIVPYSLSCCYSGTLREMGETMLPMKASIAAVLTNLTGNYVLIFGHFGCPALGVEGAAIATVISRFVELGIIIWGVQRNKIRFWFMRGAWRTLKVPAKLAKQILVKGTPLLLNECCWAMGQAALLQQYSARGLSVVAAFNISNTVGELFSVVFLSMGSAVAIIIGQALGANETERARREVWYLVALSVASCFVMGGLLAAVSPLIPRLYNTTREVRHLATLFLCASAACMPLHAFSHCSYFTLRSGGKTGITFLFDSVFSWVVSVPLAYVLVHWTGLPIYWVYPAVLSADLIKCVIGHVLLQRGVWVHNIVK